MTDCVQLQNFYQIFALWSILRHLDPTLNFCNVSFSILAKVIRSIVVTLTIGYIVLESTGFLKDLGVKTSKDLIYHQQIKEAISAAV